MEIWTINEKDEDGIVVAWNIAYPSIKKATAAIRTAHKEAWTDAEMGGRAPKLAVYELGTETTLRLEDDETAWREWTVTKVRMAE